MQRVLVSIAFLLTAMTTVPWCDGSVVNDRLYRLGEDDAGAIPLAPGNDPTADHYTAVHDASKIGLEFYHGKIGAGGGPPVGLGLAPGSSMSMRFTNIDSRYVAPAALPGILENFGIEAYVNVSPGTTDARFFYNGGQGFPFELPPRGYGLGISGGMYAALVDTNVFPTTVAALPTKPVAMALVNTGGNDFSVFINGLDVLDFATPVNPPAPADVLSLGNFVGNNGPPLFAGIVDEARLFTFAPGAFDPNTDLGPPPPSPPSGDTDGDGDVDLDDLNNVRNYFGATEAPIGDTDGDDDVDLDDLNAVRNNFGASPTGGTTVPEPAACCIALIASAGLIASRRRDSAGVGSSSTAWRS